MLACTYEDFARVLRESHALPEPPEAHGTLAGALCSSGEYGLTDWLREILPDEESEVPALQSDVLQGAYNTMVRTLVGHDSDFAPLLPDDDEPIGERTEALSQWVQGFLYGLGSGVTGDPARVSPEAGEIVRDFIEIAHGVEAEDDSEESEMAFAEVVEFVRVGVQLLFVELAPARGQEAAPGAASIH
jgi:uncharacterized protein YgfB (UPF0149 family)